MLGGKIPLDKDTLRPGETTVISKTYIVTTADLKKGELINVANVSGKTKAGSTTIVSSVTDEGRDVLQVKQPNIDKILPKTATEMYSIIILGLGILILGFILRFIRRRRKA